MDLTTTYMGLALRNPLIASASPLNRELSNLRALEDHGAGAVVLPSLFEEEVLTERRELDLCAEALPASGFAQAQTYFPSYARQLGAERYLELVGHAKGALGIPVIASLNCMTPGAWVEYARGLESAGADAIELNVYFIPADLTTSSREVEQQYLDILAAVRATVTIPIAVKLGPYFSAFGAMARALADGGANALVLFNRFYQPDVDTTKLRLSMDLALSTPAEVRLPLLWLAILYGRLPVSLAATTGVESANDVFKYLLAGADVVMTTSSLLRHGLAHMRTLLDGLTAALEAREIASVAQIRGQMSQHNIENPTLFERANYVRILYDHDASSH